MLREGMTVGPAGGMGPKISTHKFRLRLTHSLKFRLRLKPHDDFDDV